MYIYYIVLLNDVQNLYNITHLTKYIVNFITHIIFRSVFIIFFHNMFCYFVEEIDISTQLEFTYTTVCTGWYVLLDIQSPYTFI